MCLRTVGYERIDMTTLEHVSSSKLAFADFVKSESFDLSYASSVRPFETVVKNVAGVASIQHVSLLSKTFLEVADRFFSICPDLSVILCTLRC
jgi:hypothetical protein